MGGQLSVLAKFNIVTEKGDVRALRWPSSPCVIRSCVAGLLYASLYADIYLCQGVTW